MKIKVYERMDGLKTWYVLEELKEDNTKGIYNVGNEEVELPDGYELSRNNDGIPYIYHNGYAFNITKGKTGYMLYPAVGTLQDAFDNNRVVYI